MAKFGLSTILFVCLAMLSETSHPSNKKHRVQTRSLILKDGYFFPDKIIMLEDESLHLMVANLMGHSSCVASEELKFFINVSPGNLVEQIVNFKGVGKYHFSCPGLKSDLTVLIRHRPILKGPQLQGASRLPASIPDGVWVPKSNLSSDGGSW